VVVVLTQVLTQALPQRELQGKATPVQQVQPQATCLVGVGVVQVQQGRAPMAARAYLVQLQAPQLFMAAGEVVGVQAARA
jgi:hypothetical protein